MNALIQAFLNQLILFAFAAAMHFFSFQQGKVEKLNPFTDKATLILFIVIWFGFGTYFTWKFNYGIFA